MKEQTKAQLRAEIERLNGIVRYYRAEPYSIDYKVYLLVIDLIQSSKDEILSDLNFSETSEAGSFALNRQYDLLNRALECLREIPKRDDNGDLLMVDNGTPQGGYA